MRHFLTLPKVATLAGISERAIEKAVTASKIDGRPWRGATLIVRNVRGRGGRAGLRYEVLVSSLPLDLQERFKASERALHDPRQLASDSGAERDWWSLILHPALIHPKSSRERGAAITDILARPLTDWNGRPITPSRRTIERKLDALDLHGLAGIAPKRRRDKGVTRVVISKAWDTAMPFDTDTKTEIAGRLRDHIRGLYKDGAAIGLIGLLAAEKLKHLTATYLRRLAPQIVASTAALPEGIFRLPRTFIEAERTARAVAIFRKDRKSYEDTQRPRIQRTRDGLEPMQIVVGDVHHLDIVMRREDGSEVWPKAIAWIDMATNRIRMDIVLLAKGEGIRNADVIRSFVNMTQDSAWGLPRTLYLDNGSEYRWAEFVDDAMKLVDTIDYAGDGRNSRIIRARPYNAAAKVIEGIFGTLEQHYFRTIEGWAGGDRTNKKTAKVGHPTEPFSGSFDDFCRIVGAHLIAYENSPQRGGLKGYSPARAYRAAIESGWQRIAVERRELLGVFATNDTRRLSQGSISFGGRFWSCDALDRHLGATVTIRVPKFEEPASLTILPVLDSDGRLLGFAEPSEQYGVLDPRGAREASRRGKLRARAVRDLDRSIPNVSTTDEVLAFADAQPALPAAPIAGTISVNSELAAGMAEALEERADRRRQEELADQSQRLAALETLNRLVAGGNR